MQLQTYYKSAFIALFLGLGFIAFSQNITEEEVTVIAPYSPKLSKAQKISEFPKNEENTNSKFKLEYYTSPKLITTDFNLEPLKAARYISPRKPKYKQNVVRAGMGLYTTPYAELFLSGKLNRNFTLGLHIRHLSTKATLDDYAYSGFSKTGAEVWTKKTGKKNVLWVAGFYQRDAFHYYGFKPNNFLSNFSSIPDFDELSKQVFSDAGLKFNMASTVNRKNEIYRIDGSYRNFRDAYSNNENLIHLKGSYQRPIDFLGLKNQTSGVDLTTDVAITNWNKFTQDRNPGLASLAPTAQNFFHGKADLSLFYRIEFDRFDFKAGAVLAVGLDSTSTIKIYPDFRLNANIVKHILDVYIQFDGDLISPSYYSISRENPFVSAFSNLNYSSRTYRLKGGINTNILGKVDVHLWGSFENILQDMFFVSDGNAVFNNQFVPLYDDADLMQIGGDIKVDIGQASVKFEAKYQEYSLTNEAEAWYKPKWSGQLSGSYWLWDNLQLNLAVKAQSKVWAKTVLGKQELDAWYDVSLGGNYYFNKELSAFLSFNNILSQNYQLWYNYPVKGFRAMVGVSYAF
jgi:hypothetical protein